MNKAIFKERRESVMRHIGDNTVVVIANAPEKTRNSDVHHSYRGDSDFYYLTGFSEPKAIMVLCPNREQGQFVMFCQEKDIEKEMWEGRRAGLQGVTDNYCADDAFPIDDIKEILPGLIENRKKVYTTLGRYPESDVMVLSCLQKNSRQTKNATSPLMDISAILHELRLIKDRHEIALMRKCAELSCAGHKKAMQMCKAKMYEYQIQAYMECEFAQKGGVQTAYPSIVAGGENACILHYTENNAQLQSGDLLLIDAGAELNYYASDISRTFPVNGRFSAEQKALYEIVLAAQYAAIEKCVVGEHWDAPHEAAVRVIAQGLLDEKILQGSLQQVLETQSYRTFYMHKTGHWLGLDVHDVGDYQVEGQWRELEAGMVLTIEPGIYIGKNSADLRWHNIGIRIEDDVLIRKKGAEILTKSLPKSVEEIELLMNV